MGADNIQDVCIDMSASYRAGVQEHLPSATITFDEFHVVQLLTKAVDEVRRAEVKQLPELKRSRSMPTCREGILNAFDSKLTNGSFAAANAGIQAAKARVRGYGTTTHLIAITYLFTGRLTHLPVSPYQVSTTNRSPLTTGHD